MAPEIGFPRPTAQEISELDSLVISEEGIISLELMERVGRELARVLLNEIALLNPKNRSVVILVGPGNNGGDGLVIARILHLTKRFPVGVIVAKGSKASDEQRAQLERFTAVGGKVISGKKKRERALHRAGIVVDSLLGNGQNGAPRGEVGEILEIVARSASPSALRVAIDIPTGVSADSGEVFPGAFISPHLTLTVQYKKRGMTQSPGKELTGRVVEIDGGIRSENWVPKFRETSPHVMELLTERAPDSHKGTFGSLLVIGGSTSMGGAPTLSALGALSVGVGKVTKLTFGESESDIPEVMHLVAKESFFSRGDLLTIEPFLSSIDALVIGPGIGREKETGKALLELLNRVSELKIPYVLDADGLNIIASNSKKISKKWFKRGVLTPHPGEMKRLLSVKELSRFSSVEAAHKLYPGVILLKGAGTLIWNGEEGYINPTGSPALAIPGSGDVLSGMIGGFLAHGLTPTYSALLGAWIHGLAGEAAGEESLLLASDLTREVREIIGNED